MHSIYTEYCLLDRTITKTIFMQYPGRIFKHVRSWMTLFSTTLYNIIKVLSSRSAPEALAVTESVITTSASGSVFRPTVSLLRVTQFEPPDFISFQTPDMADIDTTDYVVVPRSGEVNPCNIRQDRHR